MIGFEILAAEIKFLLFVLANLLAIFIIVIFKLIKDKKLSIRQKWALGLFTPTLIAFGMLISNLTGERNINLLTFIVLIIANLSYLSKPITDSFSGFFYDGNKDAIRISIFLILSLIISFAELAGAFTIFVLIIKK